MQSLAGYGSEDELDEPTYRRKSMFRQADVNYDEVQMELSEDSSNSPKSSSNQRTSKSKDSRSCSKGSDDRSRRISEDYKSKYRSERSSPNCEKSSKSNHKAKDSHRNADESGYRHKDEKSRDYKTSSKSYDKKDERTRNYRRRNSHDSDDKHKESSTRDSRKHSYEHDRERSYDSRDVNSKNSKSYDSRDGRGSDSRDNRSSDSRESLRSDTRSRKCSSPSRHRSRSPVERDRGRRSGSRDKGRSGYYKYERNSNKMDRLAKFGFNLSLSSDRAGSSSYNSTDTKNIEKDRFFMAGITGRFTEQIQRRKLLWQKKDDTVSEVPVQPNPVGQSGKVWQNTTFAQDTDGKVANKFKRLMGMKGAEGPAAAKPATEIRKKQEEMFSSMEAQYEVARTATHTMRGVGLGFSSYQK